MYMVYKGTRFVCAFEGYRAAVHYVQSHPGTRLVHNPD